MEPSASAEPVASLTHPLRKSPKPKIKRETHAAARRTGSRRAMRARSCNQPRSGGNEMKSKGQGPRGLGAPARMYWIPGVAVGLARESYHLARELQAQSNLGHHCVYERACAHTHPHTHTHSMTTARATAAAPRKAVHGVQGTRTDERISLGCTNANREAKICWKIYTSSLY